MVIIWGACITYSSNLLYIVVVILGGIQCGRTGGEGGPALLIRIGRALGPIVQIVFSMSGHIYGGVFLFGGF